VGAARLGDIKDQDWVQAVHRSDRFFDFQFALQRTVNSFGSIRLVRQRADFFIGLPQATRKLPGDVKNQFVLNRRMVLPSA
jgi:hypothetical protein